MRFLSAILIMLIVVVVAQACDVPRSRLYAPPSFAPSCAPAFDFPSYAPSCAPAAPPSYYLPPQAFVPPSYYVPRAPRFFAPPPVYYAPPAARRPLLQFNFGNRREVVREKTVVRGRGAAAFGY